MQNKNILAMIFNEIKCHVNTSLGLVRGMHSLHPPVSAPACDIVGTFRRPSQWFGAPMVTRLPGNCAPLPSSLRAWSQRTFIWYKSSVWSASIPLLKGWVLSAELFTKLTTTTNAPEVSPEWAPLYEPCTAFLELLDFRLCKENHYRFCAKPGWSTIAANRNKFTSTQRCFVKKINQHLVNIRCFWCCLQNMAEEKFLINLFTLFLQKFAML